MSFCLFSFPFYELVMLCQEELPCWIVMDPVPGTEFFCFLLLLSAVPQQTMPLFGDVPREETEGVGPLAQTS